MRVALCIFGEIRGNKDTWQRIANYLVEPNQADVFMHHVYYDSDFVQKLDLTDQEKDFLNEYYKGKGIHYTPPADLFHILRPRKCSLDCRPSYPQEDYDSIAAKYSQIRWIPGNGNNRLEYHAILNQAESRKRALNLKSAYEKEHGFVYDVVILTRLDVNLTSRLVCNSPQTHVRAQHLAGNHKIREQLMFGPSHLMDIVGEFFDDAVATYRDLCNDQHPLMMNEYFLAQYLLRRNVHVEHHEMPLDYGAQCNGLLRQDASFIDPNGPIEHGP